MSTGPGPSDLEREIIQLCGLSKMLAPGLLRRALADVNAADPPTADDVLRALPMIETRMRAYLPAAEVRERSAQMQRLLSSWSAPVSARPSRPPLVGRG
ncbi:MAG TPA: hypothetical protein VJU61_15335 [Polyangiaceae bacterium]|nr:hypothetical protein [Polyangiaceae bacterium]